MAHKKEVTNLPQKYTFKEYSKSFLEEKSPKGKEKWDYVPEAAYLIFVQLLKQIHLTPSKSVREIKNEDKITKNGNHRYPFEILLKDIKPQKSIEEIQEGLEFLVKKDRRFHRTKNSKDQTLIFHEGIVTSPHIGHDGILVSVSAFRIKKLLEIPFEDIADI